MRPYDVMMRRGDPGYVPVWPVIPGLEVAGVIERLGDGVEDLEIGMRVAALTNAGGLAEFVVASEALTARIPTEARPTNRGLHLPGPPAGHAPEPAPSGPRCVRTRKPKWPPEDRGRPFDLQSG